MIDYQKNAIECIGWIGFLCAILAQYGLATKTIEATGFWYTWLSFWAALGLVGVSLYKHAYQPALMSVVFFLIVLFGFFKYGDSNDRIH